MSQSSDLLLRIDRLEARAEIAELAAAYAIACDDHDLPRLVGLFTEDAVLDSPSGLLRANGRAEIESMFDRVLATRGPSFHWTHDHSVAFDDTDRDRATGLVLGHAETTPNGVASLAALRYRDEYRRVAGRWRFRSRVLSFLYYLPVTEFAAGFGATDRVVVGNRRLAGDHPEKLDVWQDFARRHAQRR